MTPYPDHVAWNSWRGVPTDLLRFLQALFEPGFASMSEGERVFHRAGDRCLELREAHPELPLLYRAREGDGSLK